MGCSTTHAFFPDASTNHPYLQNRLTWDGQPNTQRRANNFSAGSNGSKYNVVMMQFPIANCFDPVTKQFSGKVYQHRNPSLNPPRLTTGRLVRPRIHGTDETNIGNTRRPFDAGSLSRLYIEHLVGRIMHIGYYGKHAPVLDPSSDTF